MGGLGAVGLAMWATIVMAASDRLSYGSVYDHVAFWLMLAAVWLLPLCGLILWWWRPSSRSGRLLVLLGTAWALWVGTGAAGGLLWAWSGTVAVVFRPLLFWVVLSWPTGRLRRSDAPWLALYSVLVSMAWTASALLFRPVLGTSTFDNPLMVADLAQAADAMAAFGNSVLLPLGAVVLLVTMMRRFRRLPASGRWMARPALIAGLLAAGGDLALVVNDYLSAVRVDATGLTLIGFTLIAADYLRFTMVPVLLVMAAARSRRFASGLGRVSTIDIGPAAPAARLQDSVAAAIGDAGTRVVFHRDDATWVDLDGTPVELGGPGRIVTVIERAGAPVAAVEHDVSFADRPDSVEVAVAAVAARVDYERLEAMANVRRAEAVRARRDIVDAQDASRRRLERDLHDGAQQRLVGLALQTTLAERHASTVNADDVASDLAAGVAAARRELRELAGGLVPALLAAQGLGAALTAFAATTPMAVAVDVAFPDHMEPSLTATAWFVVAEAVANAVKHSGGSRLTITAALVDHVLVVSVADDGIGGADARGGTGLAGLYDRVARFGGLMAVDSRVGRGTTVRVELPAGDPT